MSLPGQVAQYKMSPPFREELLEQFKNRVENAHRAGVMALFYPDFKNNTKFVLILRNTYNGVHSAQIGFPGGKLENQDNSLQDAAVRETEEEIGVFRGAIEVVKELTETYIPPSNFYVKPFLGICHKAPIFKKDDNEVKEIVEVGLTDFLDDDKVIRELVSTSYNTEIEVPAFYLNGHVVWGATAMMLNEVRVLLKSAL